MNPKERENQRYSDGFINPISLEEEIMFSLLPSNPAGLNLIDIGCGMGAISAELGKKGLKVTGIDFSETAVKKAVANGINASVCDVDAGLPFENNQFDVAWAGDILEHVFDPIGLCKEAFRVLKSNGRLLLTTPNDFNIWRRLKIFISGRSIQENIYRVSGNCKHHTLFSLSLLQYMLNTAGFKVERLHGLCYIPRLANNMRSSSMYVSKMLGSEFIVSATKM